jgi:hypothetical protein
MYHACEYVCLSMFTSNTRECLFSVPYNAKELRIKTASVVPPEDGRLTPETCRGLRLNKVFVKVKVY